MTHDELKLLLSVAAELVLQSTGQVSAEDVALCARLSGMCDTSAMLLSLIRSLARSNGL